MRIKVQIDRRNDGDYTATVKLIAWPLNRLRGLIANLSLVPFGRDVARELGGMLLEAVPKPEPEPETLTVDLSDELEQVVETTSETLEEE